MAQIRGVCQPALVKKSSIQASLQAHSIKSIRWGSTKIDIANLDLKESMLIQSFDLSKS
jgi:hypothetical protein